MPPLHARRRLVRKDLLAVPNFRWRYVVRYLVPAAVLRPTSCDGDANGHVRSCLARYGGSSVHVLYHAHTCRLHFPDAVAMQLFRYIHGQRSSKSRCHQNQQ